jgi:hypothetical protein
MEVFGWTETVVCDGDNTLVFINGLEIIEWLCNVVVAKNENRNDFEFIL